MSAVNCPNVVGPAVRAETTDGAQTRHESSWIVVKISTLLHCQKDPVCKVHHEAEVVSFQHESAGESRACVLGVSWLQCTHVIQYDPKGQPD